VRFSPSGAGLLNALKQPLPQARHHPADDDQDPDDRQVGLDRRHERRRRYAGQPRILGLRGVIDRTRPLRIVGDFGGKLAQDDVADRKIPASGRADRTAPVDEPGPLIRQDHIAGVKIAMAKLVARLQTGVHPAAQGNHGRRRRRVANGKAEVREDRARLPARHGAAPPELQQGRSLEALQHEAEAPLQHHHAEYLRRRGAGGEDGVGHVRLVPVKPPRRAWLEQLHDLTGAQAWTSAAAPSPIFSPKDPRIARPPWRRAHTRRRAETNPLIPSPDLRRLKRWRGTDLNLHERQCRFTTKPLPEDQAPRHSR